jgi:hypothetical protein
VRNFMSQLRVSHIKRMMINFWAIKFLFRMET